MKLNDLIDELSAMERAHGGSIIVTDQAGHAIDRLTLDDDVDRATTVVLVTR